MCTLCERTVRAMYITHHMHDHAKKARKDELKALIKDPKEEEEAENGASRTSSGRVQRKAASKWVSE